MDLEDILSNQCADLVSETKFEPALVHLLQHRRAGEWVPVIELYRIAGASSEGIRPEVAAAWLPSPSGQPGAALILFCDEECQWDMTAYYNAARLFRDSASQSL